MIKKNISKPNEIIEGLMDFLSETGEENLINDVSDELDGRLKKSKKADEIRVFSVIDLTSEQTEEIRKFIKKFHNLDLPVKNIIDHSLIGGVKINVGDWLLDASIKHQLNNIKKILY